MKFNIKNMTLAALATALSLSIVFSAVTTSFAQDQNGQSNPSAQSVRAKNGHGERGGFGHGRFGQGASLSLIATALGMTEADLRTELQGGKTIADVATEKGVALDTVVNAIVAAETKRNTQAVTDGRITQEQADTKIADLKEKLPTMLASQMPAGKLGFGSGGSITTITTALGITQSELTIALQAGKSVADVASEQGVNLNTVIDAIVAEQTTALTQAVTDGRLTQAQADQRLAQLKANLPHLLALKGGMRHGMGGHGQRGFDNPDGQRDGQPAPEGANQEPSTRGSSITPALPSSNVDA